ncbi:MAG TPA: DUF2950 family protein [Planctomycetota bacterium]|nr:DUF2950 family protein [Planctomycetota bacterium]
MRIIALACLVASLAAEEADYKKMLQEYTSPKVTQETRKKIEVAVEKFTPEQRKAASPIFAAQLKVEQHESWANPLLVRLGKDAVPAIVRCLTGAHNTVEATAVVLGEMGPTAVEAISKLKELIKDPPLPPNENPVFKDFRRVLYARALGGIGEDAAPFLFELAKSKDPIERGTAAYAFYSRCRIKDPNTRCLPILLQFLESDPDPRVRSSAAQTLATYGPAAKAALPALLKMYNSTDSQCVELAENTIRAIDGKVPPRPLKKDPRLSDEENAMVNHCRRFLEVAELYRRWSDGGENPQKLAGDKHLEEKFQSPFTTADDSLPNPKPLNGYLVRILKSQGPKAQSGEKSYLKDGKMTEGFALLAYPAQHAKTTRHAIMISLAGSVYISDLGDKPKEAAAKIQSFNPDDKWSLTESGLPLAPPPKIPGE